MSLRLLVRTAGALAAVAVVSVALLPFRGHVSTATIGLLLVVPVVAASAAGGTQAGAVAVAAGFLSYDVLFIPPYYTLSVGAVQNWAALGVYAVVAALVSQVVVRLDRSRAEADQRTREARLLFEFSELLAGERGLEDLLPLAASRLQSGFGLEGVALLLPADPPGTGLRVAASAGVALSQEELARLASSTPALVHLRGDRSLGSSVQVVALAGSERAVGLLAVQHRALAAHERALLRTVANHLAVTIERAELREEAVRARLLEEVDRLRRALVGAVSHDLRTPLATIKLASSSLLGAPAALDAPAAQELLGLIDAQADRLDRLVANLLDMTRIQAGAYRVDRSPVALAQLVEDAVASLRPTTASEAVRVRLPSDLPPVEADAALVRQVLVNLVENALRHSPDGVPVEIAAVVDRTGEVVCTVDDAGPGVPPADRERIFQMFDRREAGGRAGLGLAIAKAFVEAHGQRLWVEDAPGGGARFAFSLPSAASGRPAMPDVASAPDAVPGQDAARRSA